MKENIEEIIAKYELKTGAHASLDEGACIMELVSYIANEPWSDNPKCACPILTQYAIRINDRFSDEHRQLLKPIIPLLLNSKADDKAQIVRKRLIIWRNVTVTYPLILDCYKLPELAEELRKFKNTVEDMNLAAKLLSDNKKKIYAATAATAYAAAAAANAYAYATAYAAAYAYANANAYANAYAYANADPNAYAYANADPNAYAYATADPNAYAYVYAYAYAKKFHDQIAAVAIETLRMACELKIDSEQESGGVTK